MKNRWNSCRVAVRVPETELEARLSEIRREQAHFTRVQRLEQSRLWTYLFDCERELSQSLVRKFSEQDLQVSLNSNRLMTKTHSCLSPNVSSAFAKL